MSQLDTGGPVTVYAENIGGLSESEVTLQPGVTVLRGKNATGRTSLLKGLTGVLGGSTPALRGNTEKGRIQLEWGDDIYNQRLERKNGTVRTSGQTVTERSDLVNLFVSLTENNPARRAVVQDEDLRDIIMRPVDTDAIRRRIEELQGERNRIGQRLRSIEQELDRRTNVTSRRASLKNELDELDDQITELREQLAGYDADPEKAEQVEEALNSLEERKQRLDSISNRIRTNEDTLEVLRDERTELQTEQSSIETSEEELTRIETKLSELTSRERSLATTINDLSAIVDFNEELVSDTSPEFLLSDDVDSAVAKLNPASESVRCWTCGSQVDRSRVSERLDELRSVIEEKRAERTDVQSQIEDLRGNREELQNEIERQDELSRRLDEISTEIAQREQKLESLRGRRNETRRQLSSLKELVSERETLQGSELVDQYQRLSELEYERGQLEEELSSVREEIAELDRLADEQEQLRAQQDEIREELKGQRTQIRDLEESAIEAFNEHMDEILEILDYRNVARIWIERKAGTEFDSSRGGYRGGSATRFELHIVRESDQGTAYEDTIANLSESEREVVGLIVALAGYLVHNVYEVVPMMLLDSLEAVDADRIADLVDYFGEYTSYLVVALLPEDANVLGDGCAHVPAEDLRS
ncbi:chromosome segregation protein SMC [Halobacteriales archaeon SW_5_70_135]|nr:MAG: chromosome segregation protein SMC [Halobacteriales archaeon SW_5_70_135]